MSTTELTNEMMATLTRLVTSRETLPLDVQQIFLYGLAQSGKFEDPIPLMMRLGAEWAGDTDEILPDLLLDHREQLRALQRESDSL